MPGGFVRTKSKGPLNFTRPHFVLAVQYEVDRFEPVAEINLRVLKYCADKVRKSIGATKDGSLGHSHLNFMVRSE